MHSHAFGRNQFLTETTGELHAGEHCSILVYNWLKQWIVGIKTGWIRPFNTKEMTLISMIAKVLVIGLCKFEILGLKKSNRWDATSSIDLLKFIRPFLMTTCVTLKCNWRRTTVTKSTGSSAINWLLSSSSLVWFCTSQRASCHAGHLWSTPTLSNTSLSWRSLDHS